ncbi:MAG: hypothetical protein ACK564_04525, partial [Novosphingobium sp.]
GSCITFWGLVGMCLRSRRRDCATAKRLLIMAPTVPLSAAFNRMTWLPTSMPESPLSGDLWQLVLIAPMFLWDWYRRGAVQRAYLVWAAWFIPGLIITILAWNTPAWQAFARGVLYG